VASVELTQIQTPHGGSWMDGNDTTHPLLPLYTQLLPELGASVWPVAIEPAVPGVYAMAASSGGPGPAELFVANANASIDVHLDVAGSGLDLVGAGTRWSWNSSTAAPLELNLTSVPSLWDVAPDSVLLIKLVGGLGPAAIASVPSHGAPAVQHAPGINAVARRVI
ncbi:MAG: hypothetical protein L3J91_06830, partial [Thermoplasmata archaeon]|nr:hypothetical protein [Thermoplasmata archaeon]